MKELVQRNAIPLNLVEIRYVSYFKIIVLYSSLFFTLLLICLLRVCSCLKCFKLQYDLWVGDEVLAG